MSHNCQTTFVNGENPFRPFGPDYVPWAAVEKVKPPAVIQYAPTIHTAECASVQEWEVLTALNTLGASTVAQLTRFFGRPRTCINRLLSNLTKKGYVEYERANGMTPWVYGSLVRNPVAPVSWADRVAVHLERNPMSTLIEIASALQKTPFHTNVVLKNMLKRNLVIVDGDSYSVARSRK